MIRENSDVPSRLPAERIRLRIGRETRTLTADEALTLAYSLAQAKKFPAASQIAELVARRLGSIDQVAILRAYCAIWRNDYAACNAILGEAFGQTDSTIVERLQAAFVYLKLGLRADAVRELDQVAGSHPELPAVCLLLGDLLAAMGHAGKAASFWKLAIERDRRAGSAGSIAQQRLSHIADENSSHH